MATSTPVQNANLRELADVRRFFDSLSHADTFKYCLNLNRERYPSAPKLAASTIVVCLDTEGWDADSFVLKEIGINAFDSRDMAQIASPGPWGEDIMKKMYFYFARVQKNSHLRNKNASAGNPDTNRFGQMRFLDDQEIMDFLKQTFQWPLNTSNDGTVCPVVLLGHALGNDVEKIENILGFDMMAKGNLVKQIDTQIIARDVGHWTHPNNQIGLHRLINDLGFADRDLHTASNDAAMTTIAAIQLVLDVKYKGTAQPKTLQQVIDQTEHASLSHEWSHGSSLFCFRCGARDHTQERGRKGGSCGIWVHCDHCAIQRPNSQWGHRTAACVMKAFETSNSTRPNPNRRRGRPAIQPEGSANSSGGPTMATPTQNTRNGSAGIIAEFSQMSIGTDTSVPSGPTVPARTWASIAAKSESDGQASEGSTRNVFIARPAASRKK